MCFVKSIWIALIACATNLNFAHAQTPALLGVVGEDSGALQIALAGFSQTTLRVSGDTLWYALSGGRTPESALADMVGYLRNRAYWSASADTVCALSGEAYLAQVYLGPVYSWHSLRMANSGRSVAAGVFFSEKKYRYKPLSPIELETQKARILERLENNGYPFALVRVDSLRVGEGGDLSGVIRVERGPYIQFGPLKLHGDLRLPRGYLPAYLNIRPGQPYSRRQIMRLRERLRPLLFVESEGDPVVSFQGGEAIVNLFLKKKRSGRFDFVLGLLPQPADPAGRMLITGSVNAAFQNAFNQGERLLFEFDRLRPETQKLNAFADLPYIAGTPFGFDGRLNIFRRDSTWVDAHAEMGAIYYFDGLTSLRLFVENRRSGLQMIDTLSVLRQRRLPDALDLRQSAVGLTWHSDRLDYRLNPRSGWRANLRVGAGLSRILPNVVIENLRDAADPDFDFGSLYAGLRGAQIRYRFEGLVEFFAPLMERSALRFAAQGAGVYGVGDVRHNEQYRLGGARLLRGFDEESLFATRYAVATFEYRILLGANAFMAAFTDYAYVENVTADRRFFLRPWGFGAGLNIETAGGIFGISAALGRQDIGLGVDFRAAKFHLGYANLF
ncbi:MAG: BamA/TamA family outer membrane protein [Saprospiraceae bacterium]